MGGEVVVRGPGNGTVGYCALQSSAATATSQRLALRAPTRAARWCRVEVVFNPSASLSDNMRPAWWCRRVIMT